MTSLFYYFSFFILTFEITSQNLKLFSLPFLVSNDVRLLLFFNCSSEMSLVELKSLLPSRIEILSGNGGFYSNLFPHNTPFRYVFNLKFYVAMKLQTKWTVV